MVADESRSIRQRARELARYDRDPAAAHAYIEQYAIFAGDEPTGEKIERSNQFGWARCAAGQHSMRTMGAVRRRDAPRLDCDRPLRRVCRRSGCGRVQHIRCKRSKSSICRPCAARYGRRVRTIAESGTGRVGWYEYFLTVTAPSENPHCKKAGCTSAPFCQHEQCQCTPREGLDLGRWNAQHGQRWNHLRQSIRRHCGGEFEYMRGCEVQDGKRREDGIGRMALHDHVLCRTRIPLSEKTIRRLAMAAGFGHSVDVVPVIPGSKREAEYVSKYVTKAADSRVEVPWVIDLVDPDTGELREGVAVDGRYRTWSMSRQWGLSMADVKAANKRRYRETRAGIELVDVELATAVLASTFAGLELITDETSPPP